MALFLPFTASAAIVFDNEFLIQNDGSTNTWVIDALSDASGDVSIQFGASLETLLFNSTVGSFDFSDDIRVDGDIDQFGNTFTLDSDNMGSGADVDIVANQGSDSDGTLRYNATLNRWEFSNDGGSFNAIGSGELAPYFSSISPHRINTSITDTLTITGGNFDYDTTVSITGWPGTVNDTRYISDDTIEVDVTSTATEAFYSIVLTNGSKNSSGFETDDGVNALEVKTSTWNDLRSGGGTFTDGNAAGNDIRYRSGMSLSRDANGMSFAGSSPWSSWVKFEFLQWNRGDNSTLEWVFTAPDGAMMIGIGSDATNESSTSQYSQAEVEAYFNSSTNFWGLYGNNGTVGSAGNQNLSTSISSCASNVLKVKFESDGDAGGTFTLYCLPSSAPGDWDDETTVISTSTIGGTLNPDEVNIMPFIIPRSGGAQRFIAVKLS